MKLQIFPSNSLKEVAKPVDIESVDIDEFVADAMDADFLRVAHRGAAIAATQVGLPESWWVQSTDDGHGSIAVVNPSVSPIVSDGQSVMMEGCLSLPGYYSKVKRWNRVRVVGHRVDLLNPNPSFEPMDEEWVGLDAQIAQHEFDHLIGILYTQLISSAERSRIQGAVRKAKINGKAN